MLLCLISLFLKVLLVQRVRLALLVLKVRLVQQAQLGLQVLLLL